MWWLLLFFLFGVLAWMLFAPISLEIDSESKLYQLEWKGIGNLQFDLLDDELVLHFKVWFWEKKYYPLRAKKSTKAPKKETPKKKKTKSKPFLSLKKIRKKSSRLIKSFRLIHCHLHLDTDDYIRNSYWYPLFYFLSTPNRQLRINFQGDNRLKLKIENRLAKILYAILF